MILQIKTQRSGPEVVVPAQAHETDAGYDLRSAERGTVGLPPGGRRLIRTGFAIAIPAGHAGLVLPRSGIAVKHGVTVINAPGLIDPGYRGEIQVGLVNLGDSAFYITEGDRIAQLVFVPFVRADFVPSLELDVSDRNGNGFGSTGS